MRGVLCSLSAVFAALFSLQANLPASAGTPDVPPAAPSAAPPQMPHAHGAAGACQGPELACAGAVTPAFAPDGTLFAVWSAGGRVSAARSRDYGRTFLPAVAVHAGTLPLDTGPDSRPKIVVDGKGRVIVAFATRDPAFNGKVYLAVSTDNGASFGPLQALTDASPSQRFETLAFDPKGHLFLAWIDKANAAAAKKAGRPYAGAALAFAWLDKDGHAAHSPRVAHDETCECCRIGVAFDGPGRPVILFRNIFAGGIRDHGVIVFENPKTPGPVRRVSDDGWATDACPHQGPSLASGPGHTLHAAWFTNGQKRQGVFYARSEDRGRTFSTPMAVGAADKQVSRPFVFAAGGTVFLAWKEFDGEHTGIGVKISHDAGKTWSSPRIVAGTSEDSDHPLLVSDGRTVFLSWFSQKEGYRLIPIEGLS